MIENLNMSGEIYIGDFGEYSTGVDTPKKHENLVLV